MFYERCWKAIKKNPESEEDLNKGIKLSKLWVYKKYFNCTYSDKIEEEIQKI